MQPISTYLFPHLIFSTLMQLLPWPTLANRTRPAHLTVTTVSGPIVVNSTQLTSSFSISQ